MQSFRKLLIWQEAKALSVKIYAISDKMPHEEKFGLISQIRRAIVSVSSNIAEGAGRSSKKDFSNFLHIAQGSLFEVQSQLDLAFTLFPAIMTPVQFKTIDSEISFLAIKIRKFIESLEKTCAERT